MKVLASLSELRQTPYVEFMQRLNEFARSAGLQEYSTYSRIWEYPWAWMQLEPLRHRELAVLDIGSELSPFPWFLATQGFRVTIADVTPCNFWRWRAVRRRVGAPLAMCVLDAQRLDLPTASLDIYESLSVIEHVPEKARAVAEAARVLKPGGLLVITFDICEPDQGMNFPSWNGKALSMREFDELFQDSPWFEPGVSQLPWNTDAISEYLTWHRTTAPHHNYVTGAAVLRRNARVWQDSRQENRRRVLRRQWRTASSLAAWSLRIAPGAVWRAAVRPIQRMVKTSQQLVTSPAGARLAGGMLYRLAGRTAKEEKIELGRMRRVLVLRLDEIGDMVLMSAFLRELRGNLPPDAEVTLVVKPSMRNLVERCPYVNEVLTFDWGVNGRMATLRVRARAAAMARKELWPRRFDLAVNPRWDADYYQASFLTYFSGAVARVGYSEKVNARKQQLNAGSDRLLTHALYSHEAKHEVEHNLDVLRALGGEVRDTRLELWLAAEDEAFAEKTLAARGAGERLVAFGVGAGAAKRRWPASRFAEVGRRLCEEMATRIFVVGGAEDQLAAEKLQRELGAAVINLAGKATLRQTAAVMKRCELFIGNDAGPMHMAAAGGVPVIEISCQHRGGSSLEANSPVRFGPWGVESVVLQPEKAAGACRETCEAEQPHCILGVSAEQVHDAMMQVSQKTRAGVVGKR